MVPAERVLVAMGQGDDWDGHGEFIVDQSVVTA